MGALEPTGAASGRFVCFVGAAQNRQKRNACFAWRNEGFRIAGRKSLKSLCALDQPFRAIVYFQ
jgi:hypothetical protein